MNSFFGEAWEEFKRVSQQDTRVERWVSSRVLGLWIYMAILENRHGARDARSAALAEFDERFWERLFRWFTQMIEANIEARAAGEFDEDDPAWVAQSLEVDQPFFAQLIEDARPVIGPFLSTWVYGADHMIELVLMDFILEMFPDMTEGASEMFGDDESTRTMLKARSEFIWHAYWINVVSNNKNRSERTLRKQTRQSLRQHGYWFKQLATIVKNTRLWVELNIPETPEGETPTRDELAEKVEIDSIELSKALEPFDRAMGKLRRRGAPLGKRHRHANVRGDTELRLH